MRGQSTSTGLAIDASAGAVTALAGATIVDGCVASRSDVVNLCRNRRLERVGVVIALAAGLLSVGLGAQDRLRSMPGYARYEKMSREIPSALKSGALAITWSDAHTFEYARDGKRYRYDVLTRTPSEIPGPSVQESTGRGGRGGGPARGRQVDSTTSPDGKYKAVYHDRNLWLTDASGARRDRDHDRRQRQSANQVRYGELGVRRRTLADHRHVVVAR